MEWDTFIGRFHSLLVHLPIGIFLLGYFLEILYHFRFRTFITSRGTITFIYGIGLCAGIFAAITGWLLSYTEDYAIAALEDHKILGISTLVVMLFVIIFQTKVPESKGKLKLAVSTLAIILTGLTGHFGGNLTHGSSYLLKYATPPSERYEAVHLKSLQSIPPDSIQIFTDILQPVISRNCVACHNSENSKGGLRLETYSDFFKEADYAFPLVAGNPNGSEIFNRINLPSHLEKAMPPRGAGLNYTDIEIMKYWIEQGADSAATFHSETMSNDLIRLINRDYGLDYSPRPYYEKIKVDSISTDLRAELGRSQFRVTDLSSINYLLDVSFKGDTIRKEQIEILNKVAGQITFLDLSHAMISEDLLKTIAAMPHLTRVNLSHNTLDTALVTFLSPSKHLESANLNGSGLTLATLKLLLEQKNLKRVYLLDTKVTEAEVSQLKETNQHTELISSFKFQPVVEAKSVFDKEKVKR